MCLQMVVALPLSLSSRAEEIITKAEAIADREREMAKAIMGGISIVEVMGLSYEKLLERK